MQRFLVLGAIALMAVLASAKDKITIVIQVVDSRSSVREYTYITPETAAKSTTDCSTNGTVDGSSLNASTDCTTTTTPGKPPQTHVNHIPQEHVSAIMPNGDHVTLWCQSDWRRCTSLQPGNYDAEIKGNVAWVYTHELSGSIRKVKYHAVGGW